MIADAEGVNLPESIRGKLEMSPVENLMLRVLRDAMPDIYITSQIPRDVMGAMRHAGYEEGFILVRRHAGQGVWGGDDRFLDQGAVAIHIFTNGDADSDERAAMIAEGVRVNVRDAWVDGATYYPGVGSLARAAMFEEPLRKTDWATSVGPVQYADLPEGWFRYEMRVHVWIRPPLWG